MIKKPWQIWSLFLMALCVVLPAMIWLTMQIHEADQVREQDRIETELARREAELQERINSALYRMDFWATPLVAQEAARPYYLYEPIYQVNANPSLNEQVAAAPDRQSKEETVFKQTSPLVYETSEFVVMHFQVTEDDQISSPQACGKFALTCGVSNETLMDNNSNFAQASKFCNYDAVSAACVELPEATQDAETTQIGFATVYRDPSFNRFANPYGMANDALTQQLANSLPTKGTKSAQQADRNLNRGNSEYAQRVQSAEMSAQSQWATNQLSQNFLPQSGSLIREGVMRPMWLDDKLLLARRVEGADRKLVQCCWLDWEKIREQLKSEIGTLLPDVDFEPVTDEEEINFSRAMATLPIQLVVDSPKLLSTLALDSPFSSNTAPSGLKMSLWLAWTGLGLAVFASALLLKGVMQLSERRAAFVSAVTHELRTPLTTFRMYSEMLAENMVPDEKQQEYAETMKTEADRLSNLVENVLQFAGLERGSSESRREQITVVDLFERFKDRLHNRATEAAMDLNVELNGHGNQTLKTDPCKVEQVVFNLVDNACKYASKSDDKRVDVLTKLKGNWLEIYVQDHGPGVAPKFRKRLFKPFCKSDQEAADTVSGVGLGLALCQRMASSLGGKVYLDNCDGGSTFVLEVPIA
jgi:signal transduction histidine kinase